MARTSAKTPARSTPEDTPSVGASKPLTRRQALRLLDRLEKQDKSALPEFRDYLRNDPVGKTMAACSSGCPSASAHEDTLVSWSRGSLAVAECLRVRLEQMRDELGWETAGMLERLLIERVVATWTRVNRLEGRIERNEANLAHAAYLSRMLDGATRRHLAAVKSLAVLRRLELPTAPTTLVNAVNVRVETQAAPTEPKAIDVV